MPTITIGFKEGEEKSWELNEQLVDPERQLRKALLQGLGGGSVVDFAIQSQLGDEIADFGIVTLNMSEVRWVQIDPLSDVGRVASWWEPAT